MAGWLWSTLDRLPALSAINAAFGLAFKAAPRIARDNPIGCSPALTTSMLGLVFRLGVAHSIADRDDNVELPSGHIKPEIYILRPHPFERLN